MCGMSRGNFWKLTHAEMAGMLLGVNGVARTAMVRFLSQNRRKVKCDESRLPALWY
jgi:hypothetical protein